MRLKGLHHISSLSANAEKNLAFYRNILGMNLVKKTVNQENTSNYHLFYADQQGSPGTELTFFEIPNLAAKRDGTNRVSTISLLVPSIESLTFWKDRFTRFQVNHEDILEINGIPSLPFEDPEGHRMVLTPDVHATVHVNHHTNDIPNEHAILGLGPVSLVVQYLEATSQVLTNVLGLTKVGSYEKQDTAVYVFEMSDSGLNGQVHVEQQKDTPKSREGRGSVHHIAFRVETEEELKQWVERLENEGFQTSGFVDRYYFRSLYFREPNGILYELATDGPGFDIDEDLASLGKKLSLPSFLEPDRKEIEAKLKPLRT
ncbi:ring-cleaving dioxygenase [Bacillaceae bacterium JMAK1]|nr:ring-cleaving dioxygenase [Bacillaceae bacterium JMAK1]